MHKKSIEAAQKLKEEDEDTKDGEKELSASTNNVDKEELRSESIASLRAKALSYSAKLLENITCPSKAGGDASGQREEFSSTCSGFDTPRQSDSCDTDTLDPTS